ncbi:hypothetical protein B7494_g7101 [Chlorociboria aeruginascens]|nr:hypothetical protein B7494_g7101 [Chlorociboria aeruginascens]
MTAKHHVLVLGGTGTCGLIFLKAAVEAGHQLTLYVRTPSKIPEGLASNTSVDIIQGELNDVEGLKRVANCGADIFISFAGPTLGKREGTPITEALHTLYPLFLSARTFTYILTLSTPSYSAPEDTRSIIWYLAIQYIKNLSGDAYKEIKGMAEETVALGNRIDWTVFRVPLLKGTTLDENVEGVNEAFVGDKQGRAGLNLDRGRLISELVSRWELEFWLYYTVA